jgi:hypothetical protein
MWAHVNIREVPDVRGLSISAGGTSTGDTSTADLLIAMCGVAQAVARLLARPLYGSAGT